MQFLNRFFVNLRRVTLLIEGTTISFLDFDFVPLLSVALDQAQVVGNSHCPAATKIRILSYFRNIAFPFLIVCIVYKKSYQEDHQLVV